MSSNKKLILISGPCAIENKEICFEVAESVSALCRKLDIQYIFKSSFKKANRTSVKSFTGIDFDKALSILVDVKNHFG
ncbi:MAG: 3-deoxy-8-phosphooctulonate synthase, partial [Bacteroidetes bacterium]|nr:3-deoxy-8-phosphooctulonate synthase [Bacteroidota bacterium]